MSLVFSSTQAGRLSLVRTCGFAFARIGRSWRLTWLGVEIAKRIVR